VLPYACIRLALFCPIGGNISCDYRTAPQLKSTRREAATPTELPSPASPLSDEMSSCYPVIATPLFEPPTLYLVLLSPLNEANYQKRRHNSCLYHGSDSLIADGNHGK
jgi:hypothetical protein